MYDDDPKAIYRWEQGVSKSLDTVQEDEAGNLITVSDDRERSHRAKQNRITKSIRRGLIRYLIVAIDSSKSAAENDYKPCRLEVSKACIQNFVSEFYDQNPISQLALVATRDRSAERLTELSGNPKNHIHTIKAISNMVGLASLQNTILLAMSMLRHIPNYGHRELLIVFSSLSTCDPGDIYNTIKEARAQKVRISVICLVAEVFICRQVAELTGGTFGVALDATHLSELLQQHTIPPPEVQRAESLVTDFVYMGFPKRAFDLHGAYSFEGKRMRLSAQAYICPRCSTRTTDIPTQCCVCHLQLNSSSHIARSHHHLFPVPNYVEYEVRLVQPQEQQQTGQEKAREAAVVGDTDKMTLTLKKGAPSAATTNSKAGGQAKGGKGQGAAPAEVAVAKAFKAVMVVAPTHAPGAVTVSREGAAGTGGIGQDEPIAAHLESEVSLVDGEGAEGGTSRGSARCGGCLQNLCVEGRLVLRCPLCRRFFCVDCDLFVHDSLHNCPGCKQ